MALRNRASRMYVTAQSHSVEESNAACRRFRCLFGAQPVTRQAFVLVRDLAATIRHGGERKPRISTGTHLVCGDEARTV